MLPYSAPGAVLDDRTKAVLAMIEKFSRGGAVELKGGVFESWKLALAALFLGVSEAEFTDALALMRLPEKHFSELFIMRRELEVLDAS